MQCMRRSLTAKRLSKLIGVDVPLLAKIPFDPILREGGDEGNPIALTDERFTKIFDEILDKLDDIDDIEREESIGNMSA